MKTFFCKYLIDKVCLSAYHDTICIDHMFRFKDKQRTLRDSNAVYKLSRSCGGNYEDKIRRNLISRLQEHNPQSKKDVTKHLVDNPGHNITFDEPEIMATAHNLKQLLIKETLLTQARQSTSMIHRHRCICSITNCGCYVCFYNMLLFSSVY